MQVVTCFAIYELPLDVERARLTLTTYDPLLGAAVSAGVATLHF